MPITAMRASPLASPSSPSMRLNAFIAPTIQKMVRTQSSGAGMEGQRSAKPRSTQNHTRSPTTNCPASFASGESDHLSSASPMPIASAATAPIFQNVADGSDPSGGSPVTATNAA